MAFGGVGLRRFAAVVAFVACALRKWTLWSIGKGVEDEEMGEVERGSGESRDKERREHELRRCSIWNGEAIPQERWE